MSYSLKSIFESITPDNIKSIPVIKDAISIFIESLEELSRESIDIKNIYENNVIKEELIKIYLDDLYKVIQQLQYNQKVIERIEKTNTYYGTEFYKKDVIFNILNYINEEHFLTFRSYKEKKGTKASLKYIYDLISVYINAGNLNDVLNSTTYFELNELEPFNFEINGAIPEEFYHYIIHPLAHPLGFSYVYNYIIRLIEEDYFPEKSIIYNVNSIEVRCLQTDGNTTIDSYTNYETQQLVESIELDNLYNKIIQDKENNNWLVSSNHVLAGIINISDWDIWTKNLIQIKYIDNIYIYNNTTSGHYELYYLGNHSDLTNYEYHYYTLTSTTNPINLDIETVTKKRPVINYETTISGKNRLRLVYFDDETYLMQVTSYVGQTKVYYMSKKESDRTANINDYYTGDLSAEDKLSGNYDINDYDIILLEYEDQCSLYFNYESIFETSVKDIFQLDDYRQINDYWDRTNANLASLYIGQEKINTLLESEERNYIIEREGIGSISFSDIDTEDKFVIPDEIGEFYIGELTYVVDQGFNIHLDRDGNILTGSDIGYTKGRFEHFFSPNYESDLKLLLGKYELNYSVYYNSELVGIQPLKYNDTVNSSYKTLDYTLTVTEYTNDNKENFDYTAREHFMFEVYRDGILVENDNRSVLE